ncbi:RagB/SusD family nutrient uptake outer membrane protein [Pedobacter gandavensis]|uniref:RagB/SusD family nutrient uptake outer membrane protein n=1 Tax=Pedobacter gandavensis TaxID=2679963 RepID=A0ABR6ESE6_9SPHI|nr:RagB/SusD family nutrient uptake outer membrane protein [Pedobacter gandavensis]MBB2147343.1 RagB/SusD family nutrient uptake outer membrane protein [Pedobacter gandavensis]
MKSIYKYQCLFLMILLCGACKKEFLDKKPSSNILTPTTLVELRSLLEASDVISSTGGLPQISADEYLILSTSNYLALPNAVQRNGYIWSKELYDGEEVNDWNLPFRQIFYANSVLDVLNRSSFADKKESDIIRGWACFVRAYAYYDLARNFCKVYRAETADTDLGLPLRLKPDVDVSEKRSSLKKTFNQIFDDLNIAAALLDASVPPLNKNRPSKTAVMALKSRIYLYMGDYNNAELYADSTITYHNKLINYNNVSTTSDTPFGYNADEVIYQTTHLVAYSATSGTGNRLDIEVNPEIYLLFEQNDLRKSIFFRTNSLGKINIKRGYVGAGSYPFTGLATDEIYLIKAECLARKGDAIAAIDKLNQLLINRYKTNLFLPLTATSPADALQKILNERRKELLWKSLRWSDLKRLNRDGENIILTRSINNVTYTLPPGDPRYVFPIPNQEITLSGIQQNPR